LKTKCGHHSIKMRKQVKIGFVVDHHSDESENLSEIDSDQLSFIMRTPNLKVSTSTGIYTFTSL
jgi:hypothetical protein